MTQHLDEDTLLRHSLGLLEGDAEAELTQHLAECPACRSTLADVQRSIDRLREVMPSVPIEIPPLPAARPGRYRWMRMAAVFVLGIATGVVMADAVHSPAVTVVRQQMVPVSPPADTVGAVPRDGIPSPVRQRVPAPADGAAMTGGLPVSRRTG